MVIRNRASQVCLVSLNSGNSLSIFVYPSRDQTSACSAILRNDLTHPSLSFNFENPAASDSTARYPRLLYWKPLYAVRSKMEITCWKNVSKSTQEDARQPLMCRLAATSGADGTPLRASVRLVPYKYLAINLAKVQPVGLARKLLLRALKETAHHDRIIYSSGVLAYEVENRHSHAGHVHSDVLNPPAITPCATS